MGKLINTSIGKKLILSLSGLFLIVFLLVHLTINLFLFGGEDAYNQAVAFMELPVIQIMQPLLAAGFLVHIVYGVIIQYKNWKSTPVKYKVVNQSHSSKWSSRNMIWLGLFIFCFLTVHLMNYFYIMKFSETYDHNHYALVAGLFQDPQMGIWYSLIYLVSFIALGLHLNHGFWSAFQTIGMSNKIWRKRLSILGSAYALLIAVGFSSIPLYFLLTK